MKRILSILMAVCCLAMLMTACGGDPATSEPSDSSAVSTTDGDSTTTDSSGDDTTAGADDTTVGTDDTTGTDPLPTGDVTDPTYNDDPTQGTQASTEGTTTTTAVATTTKYVRPAKQEPNWKKYNVETFISPVWKGDTVYNETVMFVANKDGSLPAAPLLYKPTEVLEVRSADLSKKYKEGADYIVTADGKIQLTENSRIFSWKYDDYYCTTYQDFGLPSISQPGRYVKYAEGNTFTKTQIAVTYTHADKWDGYVPEYKGNLLPKTVKKLENGESLKIVYNGDSVAAGCNSSGWLQIAPFVPTWTEMITQALQLEFGGNISQKNTAVGGMTAEWGLSNVQTNIIQHAPDLVVLRFGTNDATAGRSPQQFKSDMAGIIEKVRAVNPNCEFILVANTMSNQDVQEPWSNENQRKNQAVLLELEKEYSGVAVARMLDVEDHLLQHKRYYDMTANNINHYNDFMVRVQASAVAQLLIKNL